MELGNLLFGNSRGEAQVPRDCGWEEPLLDLFHVCSIDEAGYPGCENAVFTIRGYDWDAECTCGFNDRAEAWHVAHPHADECYDSKVNDHSSSCRLVQPNFLFKPTGFRVNWYKYPLRDSYMTPQVTLAEWHSIIEICRAAVS